MGHIKAPYLNPNTIKLLKDYQYPISTMVRNIHCRRESLFEK